MVLRTLRPMLLLAASLAWAQPIPDTFDRVDRVVAFGDVHGDFGRFVELLAQAQLTNKSNRWIGKATNLVLCGDFIDRGPDSAKVMDLIIELEQQAARAGGRVHALLGNHEAMNLMGDLRYVAPEDIASFRRKDSEKQREAWIDSVLASLKKAGMEPPDVEAWKAQFRTEHPPGWLERAVAFLPEGKYGKWLRRHNAVVKINDVIYMHGGLSEKYASMTVAEINNQIRTELSGPNPAPGGMASDEMGPLWFRGLSQGAEDEQTLNLVTRLLEQHQIHHIVVGHTPNPAVLPRFGGRVITIDVGLSRAMGGQPAFLIIEKGQYSVMHQGRQLPLPVNGESIEEYRQALSRAAEPLKR
jgi:hypothetical protein